MFMLGVAPALLVAFIRMGVAESPVVAGRGAGDHPTMAVTARELVRRKSATDIGGLPAVLRLCPADLEMECHRHRDRAGRLLDDEQRLPRGHDDHDHCCGSGTEWHRADRCPQVLRRVLPTDESRLTLTSSR